MIRLKRIFRWLGIGVFTFLAGCVLFSVIYFEDSGHAPSWKETPLSRNTVSVLAGLHSGSKIHYWRRVLGRPYEIYVTSVDGDQFEAWQRSHPKYFWDTHHDQNNKVLCSTIQSLMPGFASATPFVDGESIKIMRFEDKNSRVEVTYGTQQHTLFVTSHPQISLDND